MHHVIAPYQSIVYPSASQGAIATAMGQNKTTMALTTPCCSLLSSSNKEKIEFGRFHQISDTFLFKLLLLVLVPNINNST